MVKCNTCGVEKDESGFAGRSKKCRTCNNLMNTNRRNKHPWYQKILNRQAFLKRKEKIRLEKMKES